MSDPRLNPNYDKSHITSEADMDLAAELDAGDALLDDGAAPEAALKYFDQLATRALGSPRAAYGRARALDQLAEKQR